MITENLRDYINLLEKRRSELINAERVLASVKREYDSVFRPEGVEPNIQAMRNIYDVCEGDDDYGKLYVFACVAYLIYCPSALYGGKTRIKLTKMMGEVAGYSGIYVFNLRKKVGVWLRAYPAFFRLVADSYERAKNRTAN